MATPLLATKLTMPLARPGLVRRARLTARLANSLAKPITIISAPAGFGKTSLLASLDAQTGPARLAWLSLDSDDNDTARFFIYLVAALQSVEPRLGTSLASLLQAPQPPEPKIILTELVSEAAQLNGPLVLVLDDYHVINAAAIHESLAFLVDHLPPTLHLILTTRADPPLPVSRWRVRDQLLEIRADDLRFSQDEAATFLTEVMGLTLSSENIAALENRTEGWVAGLQLAALSMRGRQDVTGFVNAFARSPVVVLDYLAQEVLGCEDAETQKFLLQTSILTRMCGSLCDAVTGQKGGEAQLERLRQNNLFVDGLDDSREWYRYHQLFADMLQARLRQLMPGAVTELHRRASEWLESNGLTDEAVGQALAGSDFERAARLIEGSRIRLATSGQVTTLSNWLKALPTDLRKSRPGLCLAQAWVAGPLGDYAGVITSLLEAETALAALPEPEARPLRGEVAASRAMVSSFMEDPHSLTLAQQALADLPLAAGSLRFVVAVGMFLAYFRAGDLAATGQTLRQLQATPEGQALVNRLGIVAMQSMVQRLEGHLGQAQRLSQQAIELAQVNGRPLLDAGAILAYAVLGRVEYERYEFEAAKTHWRVCAQLAATAGNLNTHVYALVNLAQLAIVNGTLDEARDWLAQAQALVQGKFLTPTNQITLEAVEAQLKIAQGAPAAAEQWARQQFRPATEFAPRLSPYDFHRFVLAEAQLAQSQAEAALDTVGRLLADAEATGHGDYVLKALVLQSVGLYQSGQTGPALNALRRALALAEPEGYLTVFIERGKPIFTLLSGLSEQPSLDPALKALARRLLTLDGAQANAPLAKKSLLVEPLSERELEILRLVADGLTDREIAEKLVVAVGTAKKHLSNIYGKLGVRSRTQALAAARDLGLL